QISSGSCDGVFGVGAVPAPKTASAGARNTDEGLTRNLTRRSWAMTTVTLNALHNEAISTPSPQLAAADAFAAHVDITLELADLTVGQLSAVAALMLSLDAAVAQARATEHKLAEHLRH